MEPEQQFIRHRVETRPFLRHRPGILIDCARACFGPVKADRILCGLVIIIWGPVCPSEIIDPRRGAIMVSGSHEMGETKRRHIVHDRLA